MTFPNGLKRTLALFSKATYDIFNSDEIEKVKNSASRKERKTIEILQEAYEGRKPESFILWVLAQALIECPLLTMDILTYMVTLDDCTFSEKELAEFFSAKEINANG